ncbi:MAG: amino acid--tRNA ligase-related protein [Lachnospira sp.]
MELSFVDVDDVIDVNERLLAYLFKEVLDIDVALPIQRMTWQEAMDRFGSDKPDLRLTCMESKNNTGACEKLPTPAYLHQPLKTSGTSGPSGINAKGRGANAEKKKIDALVLDFARVTCARVLLIAMAIPAKMVR